MNEKAWGWRELWVSLWHYNISSNASEEHDTSQEKWQDFRYIIFLLVIGYVQGGLMICIPGVHMATYLCI